MSKRLIHEGVRPIHPVETRWNNYENIYTEIFPDGSKKFWNNRTLNSGCDNEISAFVIEGDLIYCDHCQEWFNEKQFTEVVDD